MDTQSKAARGAVGRAADRGEERRPFSAGRTRARDLLILSHAASRSVRGAARATKPSPFLAAIEERLLERNSSRGRQKSRQFDRF